ncbi:Eukaryotic translation initiation factor 3 subunit K [Trichinella patagoniensis]|uniref:Eukaryotic translation initiation factor 3 subunit K n=1 Tax=Trichinella patagoniensis TaxID=990121 RepID=A0A0V0ZHS8_9BILA|nr:Eukaryotic translation initiation factor 3 subunit K [Trichinella patagoniensis]
MEYNQDNIEFLEKHVGEQCDKQSVYMEANLTLLKLCQQNLNWYNETIVCSIILKCIMALAAADIILTKCLLDGHLLIILVESECLKAIFDSFALLKRRNLKKFGIILIVCKV